MFSRRTPSDKDLLQQIKQGDRQALVLLYERNFQAIRNHIRQNSGGETDADDILQEAVIVVWQQAQRKDFGLTSKLDTLIFGIAKNLWLKELRKRKRVVSKTEDSEFPSQWESEDESMREEENSAILVKYVQQLSEACRDILYLFYFDRLEMDEIAQRLNFANADTVKAKKYQCKKKLEELIKKDYKVEDLF